MKILIAALVSIFSAAAFAGDYAHVVPVGFSADGANYAFLENGVDDGSGAAYSTLGIVDVAKNVLTYQADFSEAATNEDQFTGNVAAADKIVLAKGTKALKKAGIVPFANLGRDLVLRLPTDISADMPNFQYAEYLGARSYQVQLSTTPAPKTDANSICDSEPQLLKATLFSEAVYGEKEINQVLQDDQRLPQSRLCANNYFISRITVYKTSFVAIVSFQTLGFEGPNTRAIPVTGIHDFEKEN